VTVDPARAPDDAESMPEPTPDQRQYMAMERALRAGRLDELPHEVTDRAGYPNVRDTYTWTPLIILAISWAPVECVRELVSAGADVNVQVDDGFPALLNAVMSGRDDRLELVRALVELGADLEARGINGWTALHAAASMNDVAMVQLLVRLGADRAARTGVDDDATPLQEAERAGATDAVRVLQ
jgi:ankyrin repeat protein